MGAMPTPDATRTESGRSFNFLPMNLAQHRAQFLYTNPDDQDSKNFSDVIETYASKKCRSQMAKQPVNLQSYHT